MKKVLYPAFYAVTLAGLTALSTWGIDKMTEVEPQASSPSSAQASAELMKLAQERQEKFNSLIQCAATACAKGGSMSLCLEAK